MGYRNYGPANGYVVSPDGTGDFTTIASAITAATTYGATTIFLKPGTYNENPALIAGITICAFPGGSEAGVAGAVTINGKCTFSGVGTATLQGLTLQTNSDNFLAVTGSSASVVNVINCFLNCSNATGITFSSSSASARLILAYCYGDIGTTGIKLFAHTSAGIMTIRYTLCTNSGATLTANTCATGTLNLFTSYLANAITYSSGGLGVIKWSEIGNGTTNQTALTTVGGVEVYDSRLVSGSATPYSCGGADTVGNLILSHTNMVAVTGSGTLTYSGIWQTSTIGTISCTGITGKGVLGQITSTTPSAGYIGERFVSTVSQGSPVALTTTTQTNMTSITITSAGVWDLSLVMGYVSPSVSPTLTQLRASISVTSATLSGAIGDSDIILPAGCAPVTGVADSHICIPAVRVTTTGSTPYYAVAKAIFSAGNISCYGRLSAVRVA